MRAFKLNPNITGFQQPSHTISIKDFEGETIWPKQAGTAQSTLSATKNSDWLVHIVQTEPGSEFAQDPIGSESQIKPDIKEFGTPLNIPAAENMTKQQQSSVSSGPVEIASKTGNPLNATLPENDTQRPAPVLWKAQPSNAVPADMVAAEPARLHVARPVISESGPAARDFPVIREMMSHTHPNTPEPSVRLQMTKGADVSSTPPTSNVEGRNIAHSNRSEPEVLILQTQEQPSVPATTDPNSLPTDVKLPLSPGSGPQQTQVRLYQSGQAEVATVNRQAADVVAKSTKPPESYLEPKVTEHYYGGKRSGLPPKQDNFQTATAANPQAELPKSNSSSSSPEKPDQASAVRAISSGFSEAPVQQAETPRTVIPKTTVSGMKSPEFQSNDVFASDTGQAFQGGGVPTQPSLTSAETAGSTAPDKPDTLLLPGVSGSGSSATASANPTPAPTGPAQDPIAFARLSSQLASVAAQNPNAPIELTLSPEELGRVQMNFTTQDGALSVTISAERPETLALMRRHIDLLMQDFRELGFSDVNLGFEDRPAQQTTPEQTPGRSPPDQQTEDTAASGETPGVLIDLSTSAAGSIDVRL